MDTEYTTWDEAEVIFYRIKEDIVKSYATTYDMKNCIQAPSVILSWTQCIVDALDEGRRYIELPSHVTISHQPEIISF